MQNIDNRNKINEYIESLFYNECFELRFPFTNCIQKQNKINDLYKKTLHIFKKDEEIKILKYFAKLQDSLKIYKDDGYANVYNTFFDPIKQESVNKLDKTELEYFFTNFPLFFSEYYEFTIKTS